MSKQNKSDLIVVGMGIAGMMAAYTAAKNGQDVTLVATGLGAISIASGCIDVLGYIQDKDTMQMVHNPFDVFTKLEATHPYNIIGRQSVEKALNEVQQLCKTQNAEIHCKHHKNTLVPTIIGTLKPTYFYPASSDSSALFTAQRILVASVDAIRDCHPKLIVQQLQKYPTLKNKHFGTTSLTSHFCQAHRAINALDMARYVDSKEGFAWLENSLAPFAKDYDVILIPPILGINNSLCTHSSPWKKLQATLGCSIVEMISLPPGVGGYRLANVFMKAIHELQAKGKIHIIENATICQADIANGHCNALMARGEGVTHSYEANNFILATGGILGGGIQTKPSKAYETILGIEIPMPLKPEDWAADTAFGSHAFTKMGVTVNDKLQAIETQGNILADNVFFAGRTIGMYDFAAEKNGNGVALATAWHAAQQAILA